MVLKQEDWRRLSVRRRERERKQNSTMRSVGFKALVQLRNLVIKSIRIGYRSVCHDHPFLVGTILFLVFLYRSCPLLFSLLVSASPVLVCTFALLGILLNYGNPQFPETEVDEKSSEISSARAVRLEHNTILGKDEPLGTIDTLSDVRRVVSDRGIEAVSFLDDVDLVGEPKQVESTVSHSVAPTWQSSRVIGLKEQLAEEPTSEYNNQKNEIGKDINWRELGYEAVASTNVAVENPHDIHEVPNQDFENDKSAEALVNGQREEEDSPESSWGQWSWTKVDLDGGSGNASRGNDGSDDEDEDESFDSGSDGAESSSPDPSMADITPLLDELYPLLENDNPDLARQPSQTSDVSTDRSHESSESSISSDGETDHDEAEEDAVSGAGGDDDDEGLPNKEDEAKSAIKWTEDDQKNLMDLGSSEMERNQRLESLIARRRSRRDMRMMMERNLIDLDGMDLAPQIAPIVTTRQNPFDSPTDSYNYMGLPPIPGSAPSVFSQRQNPFDLPYDSSEEKPDLTADSFQQEFTELTQKDPLFRRHESFNIGSSTFDFHRHDRTGGRLSRFRPYFLPERIDSDGTGHSPFTRQSSDLSEASLLRRQLSGSSSFQRQASGFSESSFHRQSSDISESKASSAAETEPPSPYADEEEMKFSSSNNSQERPVSETEDKTHLTEHGYHASSVLNSATEEQSEKIHINAVERYTSEGFHLSQRRQIAEIKLGDSRTDAGEKSWFAASWDLAASEGRQGEIHQGLEPAKKQGSCSSLSSMSEVNDDVTEVDRGLVKEEVLEQLTLSLITEVGFNGLGMSAITEEENSSSSASSVSSSEEYNDLNEEKNINNSPRSATLSEEYNDATAEKKSTHSRSSSASSSEEYNDVVEESKRGHSRSTSASSSEEYSDAAKVGVKVDKDFVFDHHGASELHRRFENQAGEAQEVNVPPRASNLDESSENPSDWVQEVPTVGHTTENQEPVYDLSPQASSKLSAVSSDFHLVEETDVKDPRASELSVEDHHNVVAKAYDLQDDGQHLYSAELTLSGTVERDSNDVKEQDASEATFSSLVTVDSPEMSREVDLVKELDPEAVSGEFVSASNVENHTIETEKSVHSQYSESKKELPTDDKKFEEMSDVDKLNHNIHGEVNALFEFSGQTTETSIPADGKEQNPLTNISDVIEPVPNKSEVTPPNPEGDKADSLSELGESIASDNKVYGDLEDMKEMDEAILSELDAVGDFSLGPANLGPDLDTTGGDVILDKTEQDAHESGIKEERPQ